jgi:oligoendopeptidase F
VSEPHDNELPTWDLSDLYSGVDDPELTRDIEKMGEIAQSFEENYRGRIGTADVTAALLLAALRDYQTLLGQQYKPGSYAQLHYSTDTADTDRAALLQRAREASSAASTHLIFFDLEIGEIPQDTYDTIIDDPALGEYRHYVEHERRLAEHRLTEPEEKILEETANTGGRAFGRLFVEVSSRRKYDYDGEELTQSVLLAKFHDPDRETRRKAAESLTAGVAGDSHVLNYIYNTLLHEKQTKDRLRGFDTPEASRHLGNEVTPEVVDAVVDTCVANYDVVADYYDLKRGLLGLDELTHYDRYAPITGATSAVPFDEARQLVLDSFDGFSPQLRAAADPFFTKGWIDAALGDHKQGGAYCAGVTPEVHPYVFMNYMGTPRDVMTLAHELGHGVHDVLAARQSLLNYHPVLPLAETASTFAEMLVFDRLRGTLESPEERLALLCGKIEDTFATVFRQIAMFRFEQRAHRLRRAEGEQTVESYSAVWQETMQEMFGESLTLGDDHASWWLYIPHVYRVPFYVYAYAFGELLVLSLYGQYQRVGEAFVPKYFGLLGAGGSAAPADLVSEMGFDIASRDFWQAGCDLIRDAVAEARALAAELGRV